MLPTERAPWVWLPADELCKKITKGTTPPKSSISSSGKIPFLRVNNLKLGGSRRLSGDMIYVDENTHKDFLKRSISFPQDILMNIVGPPLGKITIADDKFPEYNINQAIVIFRGDQRKVDHEFLYYYLSSEHSQSWFETRAKKTSGQQNLTIELCKQVPVPYPPLSEQRKIAEILSTWDATIEATENLLSNAEAQKHGLMQQLLTGERRLKKFKDTKWRSRRIGDLLEEIRRPVNWSDDELYKLVSIRRRSGGAFLREELFGREILTKTMRVTRSGDFLISKMQVVHGAMTMTPPELDGFHISGSYIALVRRTDELSIRFFDWLSRTPLMYRKALLSSYGVHIEKMTFNLDWFLDEHIRLPETVEEQEAVADILDDAEAICKNLGEQLIQLKIEKRALARQLVTGKRRVKA